MTDVERIAEDTKLGKFDKQKSSYKFMQKYYHKGVFYMDDSSLAKDPDDVRAKDYSAPTLWDKFDVEKLPEVMQVKNFGRRGRTKYTHLLDQDTTRATTDEKRVVPLTIQIDDNVKNKFMRKRAGVGDIDSAGRLHKKSK